MSDTIGRLAVATLRPFEFLSLKLWFWSEDHEPPQFHAKRIGEWEVKVKFMEAPEEMIEILWADKKPARRVINELTQLAEQHRLELLEQWEEIRGN